MNECNLFILRKFFENILVYKGSLSLFGLVYFGFTAYQLLLVIYC